jgi:hypothetical protein
VASLPAIELWSRPLIYISSAVCEKYYRFSQSGKLKKNCELINSLDINNAFLTAFDR